MTRRPNLEPVVANIVRTYRKANAQQVAAGINWYARAHTLALALDPKNVARAAGIIAALSPRLNWEQNVILAQRTYADGQASGCLKGNARKANAIFDGSSPLDVLGGDKVRAFFATILDPTDRDAVVIDRHAFDIAVGRVTDDETRTQLARKGQYETFAEAYRQAARILGVAPSQAQAVTWTVWRETEIRTAAANRRAA